MGQVIQMLSFLADKLSCFLIQQNTIEPADKDVYAYGFELLLSTLLNTIVLILFALAWDMVVPIAFFMVPFAILRMTAGGYHAKTHLACVTILAFTLLVFTFLFKTIQSDVLHSAALPSLLISIPIVLRLSPVEDVNRPFTEKEVWIFRKRSVYVLLAVSLALLLLVFVQELYWISFPGSFGLLVASVSLIAEDVKNKKLRMAAAMK